MNPVRIIRGVLGATQSALADQAHTSQPTIAAYEAGIKSPTWGTIERIARSGDLACYPWVGPSMTRDQARSLVLHQAIVVRLHGDPDEVMAHAFRNLDLMRQENPYAGALIDEWADLLALDPTRLASRMLDPSEHGRDLRQVTPFAGVLSGSERATVYREFRAAA